MTDAGTTREREAIVTQEQSAVTKAGTAWFGTTLREEETLDMLLEPNVRTYADAARRLGQTEGAVKQRMSRLLFRYRKAQSFVNQVNRWKGKRRAARRDRGRRGRRR